MTLSSLTPPIRLKPALSVAEQIQLLKTRGLSIENIQEAEDFLSATNYYHLNYYFHFFLDKNNEFYPGLTFSSFIIIYQNDQWLRTHIFFLIEQFEMDFQTRLARYLALKYGSDVYYKKGIFHDQHYFAKVQDDFNNVLTIKQKHSVIRWHNIHYGGRFPIWVIVEFLTITSFCNLYLSMNKSDREQLANNEYQLTDYYFKSWIFTIAKLRNECAHNGQLFRREITPNPTLHPSFGLPSSENKLIFSRLLILKRLLSPDNWKPIYDLLSQRNMTQPFLNKVDYGFPSNWQALFTK